MNSPADPGKDRRAVPRHLRDGENDLLSSTGTFGQRVGEQRALGARGWVLIIAAVLAAAAIAWFLLK